jgi:topoisomerase-4 subunit B
MKLQPVMLLPETHIQQLLEYYMGKNTPNRQDFIIENLKVELDLADESIKN